MTSTAKELVDLEIAQARTQAELAMAAQKKRLLQEDEK